jgi:acyl carrier protein
MEMNIFIENFADQFDDTEISVFSPETKFRDLDEWSSLTGLAALNMIEKKYQVKIIPEEFRTVNTIQELYELIQSKR